MKLYLKVDKLEHGKEIPGGLGRWCKAHQVIHGRFFVCEEYPRQTQEAIRAAERRWLSTSASIALVVILCVLLLLSL